MIFGRNFVNGHHFILVGLSTDNLKKIRARKPLSIGPVQNDPILENATIIIMAGTTENEIVEQLKKDGMVSPKVESTTNVEENKLNKENQELRKLVDELRDQLLDEKLKNAPRP